MAFALVFFAASVVPVYFVGAMITVTPVYADTR